MNKLYVYGDFDWLDRPKLIGELGYDSVRGNDVYTFSYDKTWLAQYGQLFLSDDLQNFVGIQFTQPDRDIFSCFSDALPDRWGRTLINRREQIAALEENRSPKHLSSFDYLIGIEDCSRMGGFRFAFTPDSDFINCSSAFKVPPISSVRELMAAAHNIELSEEKNILPEKKWIAQLIHPGTSLGGARPKASVIDEYGYLTIAKFPSRNDDYDVALWEHFSHIMARKAGLNVSNTRVIKGEKHHIFLSRRFDRTENHRRIHFASALTLLGLTDGDNYSTGHGYLDIVDFIVRNGCNVEDNLKELFRRVAFNIIIGNSDDHFRNHGFLLTPKGWILSPAYDMNPTLSEYQSILIDSTTNKSDLDLLLASSEQYLLPTKEAQEIIDTICRAFADWRDEARKLSISQRDVERFAPRLDKFLKKG